MKKLFAILASAFLATAAQGQYANTQTGALAASPPITILSADGTLTYNPTAAMLAGAGWLKVGWTQSPSNGWGVLGSYVISPSSNGYCSLLITGQYNLQVASDAVWTNNPMWPTISNEAHSYSNLTWCYSPAHYTASLTNFVNTPQFTVAYYQSWVKTNASATVSNSVDFLNASWMLADIVNFAGSSTNFPWRLCP